MQFQSREDLDRAIPLLDKAVFRDITIGAEEDTSPYIPPPPRGRGFRGRGRGGFDRGFRGGRGGYDRYDRAASVEEEVVLIEDSIEVDLEEEEVVMIGVDLEAEEVDLTEADSEVEEVDSEGRRI